MTTDINTQRREDALTRADDLADFILPLRAEGKSLREVATAMTAAGIPTANGGAWGPKQVQRIMLRLEQRTAAPVLRDPLAELVVPEQAPLPIGADPLAAMALPAFPSV